LPEIFRNGFEPWPTLIAFALNHFITFHRAPTMNHLSAVSHQFAVNPRLFVNALCSAVLACLLAACSDSANTSSSDAVSPVADAALVAQAAADADAAVASHPLCDLASFADVSAVAGGNFNKLDVIAADDMNSVDCIYLDMSDLYNGLNIRFVSTEKLLATSSKWLTAASYFEEWGRGGTPVAGIGTSAVWADLLGGLLVLQGEHVLLLSAAKLDPADAAARAKLESLAGQVVGRLP